MGDRANATKSEINCLYIRLPIKIKDEEQVKDLHPDILQVKLRRKDKFRFCHITFENHDKCLNALRALKKIKIEGKRVIVRLPLIKRNTTKIGFSMVLSANSFLGAPNNGLLKGPTADDDIELYISEVEADGVDDSVYYITDEEVYDDTSYVDDTYDEDDYYFSEADDDDYVDEEDLDVDETDSDSENTDHDPVVVRLLSDTDSSGSDKSVTSTSTTQLDQAADPKNNG